MEKITIDGIEVLIEGEGAHTVLMIHGWPDTRALWDTSVAALQGHFRCVRFTLPGYDLALPPRATSVHDMTTFISKVVAAVSPFEPVTLLIHDWGCFFGYEYAMRNAARVARIVAVDIGDHNSGNLLRSLGVGAKLAVLFYQLQLAIAWKLGQLGMVRVANGMTRWMIAAMGQRHDPLQVGWQMNYPYAMRWFGLAGGFKGIARVAPTCPMLYIYGEHKPFMFQSPEWLAEIAARSGSEVHSFKSGHWVMLRWPVEFTACVKTWLLKQTTA